MKSKLYLIRQFKLIIRNGYCLIEKENIALRIINYLIKLKN